MMNGFHDIGGMDNMGTLDIEENEPVFHEPWEGTVYSLMMAMMATGYFKPDEGRHAGEQMSPVDYFKTSYYEKWLFSLEKILEDKDILTQEEIKTGKSIRKEGGMSLPPVPLETLQYALSNRMPANLDVDIPEKFSIGDKVTARNINPSTHTRLPRYIRGRRGIIEKYHGVFLLPDTRSRGEPDKPQHVYNVCFSSEELWGDNNPPHDKVYVDLYEDYMEPDEQSGTRS